MPRRGSPSRAKPRNRLLAGAVYFGTYRQRLTGNDEFDSQQVDLLSDIRKKVDGVMTADKLHDAILPWS